MPTKSNRNKWQEHYQVHHSGLHHSNRCLLIKSSRNKRPEYYQVHHYTALTDAYWPKAAGTRGQNTIRSTTVGSTTLTDAFWPKAAGTRGRNTIRSNTVGYTTLTYVYRPKAAGKRAGNTLWLPVRHLFIFLNFHYNFAIFSPPPYWWWISSQRWSLHTELRRVTRACELPPPPTPHQLRRRRNRDLISSRQPGIQTAWN